MAETVEATVGPAPVLHGAAAVDRQRLLRWLSYLLTALMVVLVLFPWLWVFSLGFKSRTGG